MLLLLEVVMPLTYSGRGQCILTRYTERVALVVTHRVRLMLPAAEWDQIGVHQFTIASIFFLKVLYKELRSKQPYVRQEKIRATAIGRHQTSSYLTSASY